MLNLMSNFFFSFAIVAILILGVLAGYGTKTDKATGASASHGMEQLALETKMDLFKWKQYESATILLTVRWY